MLVRGSEILPYVWVVLFINCTPGGWYHKIFCAIRVRDNASQSVSNRPTNKSDIVDVHTSLRLGRPGSVHAPNPPSDDCLAL